MPTFATLLYLTLFGFTAAAQTITLQNIDRDDYNKLVSDFSANSQHSSVSGASSLGEIFGFEVGVVGGSTATPEINRLAKEQDASANIGRLYHAAIFGAVSVPFGITIDAGLVPKVGSADFKYNTYALGAKWTFSQLLGDLPVSLAAKAQVAKANVEFKSAPGGVDTHFEFNNTVTTVLLLVSKDLGLLEPYFAFGSATATGRMTVNGSGSVFSDSDYAASQTASAKRNSIQYMVGTEVKLGVFKLGVEYNRLFSTNRFTGKFTFYF